MPHIFSEQIVKPLVNIPSMRVTNICECVIFTVTGELVEMDVEDAGLDGMPG